MSLFRLCFLPSYLAQSGTEKSRDIIIDCSSVHSEHLCTYSANVITFW